MPLPGITGPPSIQPGTAVSAQLGRPARLRCTVNSVPLPAPGQTHWYFNGHTVRPDAQHSFEREEFLGGVVLILKISHMLMTDYGKYNCTVENGFGSAWQLIDLVYQDDVTLQFIIGAAVIIGILIVTGAILLCLCRQRGCLYRYKKGHSNGPGKVMDGRRGQSQHSLSDFSATGNTEFKQAVRGKDHLFPPNRTAWFSGNSQCNSAHLYCGQGIDDQQRSFHNASKLNGDKHCFDSLKDETVINTAYPVVISTGYCSSIPSCQLLQPVNQGGTTVLSPIDPRLLNSSGGIVDPVSLGIPCASQQSYLASEYSTATLVPLNSIQIAAPQTSLEGTNMQVACNSYHDQPRGESASHTCYYPPDQLQSDMLLNDQAGRPGVPFTTLNLTNGIPVHTAYSGIAANEQSSLRPQLCTNGQSPVHFLSMTGSYDKMLKFTTVPCCTGISLNSGGQLPTQLQDPTSGDTYFLEEQTTNI